MNWKGGRRLTKNGYIKIWINKDIKYIFEHVLVCEIVLGKRLPYGAEPHHINGDKQDNTNNNLIICQDRAYHMLIHQRERALKESGDANKRKCRFCQRYDKIENLIIYKPRNWVYHKNCENKYQRDRYYKKCSL